MNKAQLLAQKLRSWQAENPKTDMALGMIPFVGQGYGAVMSGAALADPEASNMDKGFALASMIPMGKLVAKLRNVGPEVRTIVAGEKGMANNPSLKGAVGDIWQGPDFNHRIELDDNASRLRRLPKVGETSKLGDVLDHPDLYKSYPELADMAVLMRGNKDLKGLGQYDALGKQITLNADQLNINNPYSSAKSVLLHEGQHAIQDIEDYGAPFRGTNPGSAGSFYRYMKDAGEAEARTTQHRQWWNAKQREAVPFPDHFDTEQRKLDYLRSIGGKSHDLVMGYGKQLRDPELMAKYLRRYQSTGPREEFRVVNPVDLYLSKQLRAK